MDGQTVVIDDYLEVRPEAAARLQRAIRAGQIQVGPWYTLPDEFLVSGETLIRDLQRGIAEADAHGGSMRAGYLPDSFGHAAQMPQIYRQLGFTRAVVWRGVPLAIDRTAFVWEAPDGSRIVTAYMGNSYSHGENLPGDPPALADRIRSALEAMEPFHPGADVLLMNGNDHVQPQQALTATVRGANTLLNETRVRVARLDEYLAKLADSGWPVWRGELRSSARANVLMGTLSVRAEDKLRYFKASTALERWAEPLAALSGVDCAALLQEAWTLVLQNAAHDTACGSGIDAVARESSARSGAAAALARRIVDRCLPALAGDGQVWNPSPFARRQVLEVEGRLVQTPLVGGFSTATLVEQPGRGAVTARGNVLENDELRCTVRADGALDIVDKDRNFRYDGLYRLVDGGDAGDEYNYSPPAVEGSVAQPVRNFVCTVREGGPLRGRIEATFDYVVYDGLSADRRARGPREVAIPARLALSLETDVPRLDIALELDNRAADHRLRAHFPLPFRVRESAADTAFHVTRRPVIAARRDRGSPELELPTYPMWSFADVSDGRCGMTLIGHGLHEYEVVPSEPQELALTLLRCVGWLSRGDLATRTGHAGPAMKTPGAQAQGEHKFRCSLYFHPGDWAEGKVWRAAECALLPMLVGRGPTTTAPLPIEVDPECIQVTAVTPRSSGFDLRLLNASDRGTVATIRLGLQATAVSRIGLANGEEQPVLQRGGAVPLELRPWEIATLKVLR